jgi:hypothetical protein
MRLAVAVLLGCTTAAAVARAAGCDLSQVVGYQLVQQKTIEGYMQDNRVVPRYEGCVPERVLVFTDHTGVRCKAVAVAHAILPSAFIFARDHGELKLCVDDDMMDIVPAR